MKATHKPTLYIHIFLFQWVNEWTVTLIDKNKNPLSPITYIIKPFIHRIFRMVIGYCCSFKAGNLPPPQSIIA